MLPVFAKRFSTIYRALSEFQSLIYHDITHKSSFTMPKSILFSPKAPAPIGPYSQGIKAAGSFLFLSGQIALGMDGAMHGDNAAEQTVQVLANISALLSEAGYSPNNVVKTTIYLKDMNDFAAVNAIYGEFFGKSKPARSTVEVARLPKDALVEIEVIVLCED